MEINVVCGKTKIILKQGDITKESVDVIVNAANSSLLGGGGVDGAIHAAGGNAILEDCKRIRKEQADRGEKVGCLTGHAVITTAGQLHAKYVIHTVGPDMRTGLPNGDELLRNAYENSLRLAADLGAKTIAFPSISTGIFSFPIERAAVISLTAMANFAHKNPAFDEIRMVLYFSNDLAVYEKVLKSIK